MTYNLDTLWVAFDVHRDEVAQKANAIPLVHRMGRLHGKDGNGKSLFGKGTNKDRNHVEHIECERQNVHALVEIEDAQYSKNGREVAVEGEDQREEVGQL